LHSFTLNYEQRKSEMTLAVMSTRVDLLTYAASENVCEPLELLAHKNTSRTQK